MERINEYNVEYVDETKIVARNREQLLDIYDKVANNETCLFNWKNSNFVLSKIMTGEALQSQIGSGMCELISSVSVEELEKQFMSEMHERVKEALPRIKEVAKKIVEKIEEEEKEKSKKSKSSKKDKTEKKGRGRPKKVVKRGRGRPRKQ